MTRALWDLSTVEERVAAAMWRGEAERAAPNVAKNRTPEAFADESTEMRDLWLHRAGVAIDAILGANP